MNEINWILQGRSIGVKNTEETTIWYILKFSHVSMAPSSFRYTVTIDLNDYLRKHFIV